MVLKRRRAKLDILMQEEIVSKVSKKKEIEVQKNLSESEEENESAVSSESCSENEMTDEENELHVDNSEHDEAVEDKTEQDLQKNESSEDEDESDESSEPEIITFVDPMQAAKDRRQKLKAAQEARSQEKQGGKRRVIEMEQITKKEIRHQIEDVKFKVQQYGLQSYTPEERRKRERARLIKLGAKAPKAEWKNYKALMEEKKQAAIDAAEKKAGEDPSMAFMTAPSLTKPKKVRNTFWSDRTKNSNRQSIGSWKGGQLTVSKTKIKKFS